MNYHTLEEAVEGYRKERVFIPTEESVIHDLNVLHEKGYALVSFESLKGLGYEPRALRDVLTTLIQKEKVESPEPGAYRVRHPSEKPPRLRAYEIRKLVWRRGEAFSPVILSAMYAAKTTLPEGSPRRVFVQDFAASLNRKGLLRNEDVQHFLDLGYEHMKTKG